MAKSYVYKATGFSLISSLQPDGVMTYPAASVSIAKGDALHNDGTGYATNATTAFADTFLGIAANTVDNSGGSKGDLNVMIIPPLPSHKFIVPCSADATATQAYVGIIVDLAATCNTVDLTDSTGAANAMGLLVDEIDISADAIAANTYGYAIGHFVPHTA